MSRAEQRRSVREKNKSTTATYNLTRAQLDALVAEQFSEMVEKVKREATEDAVNKALILMLTLPLEVLMDHYWQKSYEKRLPGFVNHVLSYYNRWQDGELDLDNLRKDLWEYGGIRLEESER